MERSRFYGANIRPSLAPPTQPVGQDKNIDILSLDDQKKARYKQDTWHRNVLVWWMMVIVSLWLVSVLLITAFNNPWCLRVSETVLVTLLATTTVNVLGLAYVILTGLFGGAVRRYKRK